MTNVKNLKLMPDYSSSPLWSVSPDEPDNIDLNDLPLSEELKQDLNAWAARYDDTLNMDDPYESVDFTESEKQQFKKDGEELYKRLREELSDEFKLTYFVP